MFQVVIRLSPVFLISFVSYGTLWSLDASVTLDSHVPKGSYIAEGILDFLLPLAVKLEHPGQLVHPFPYLTFRGKGEAKADVVGGSLRVGGPVRPRIEGDALFECRLHKFA